MKWIKLEDKKPETSTHCLIWYCECWNHDKTWKIAWAFVNSLGEFCMCNEKVKPTHWMPLPDPPGKTLVEKIYYESNADEFDAAIKKFGVDNALEYFATPKEERHHFDSLRDEKK
jgi:hypothetical protein